MNILRHIILIFVKMRQTDVWIKLTQNEEKTKMHVFCFFHLRCMIIISRDRVAISFIT